MLKKGLSYFIMFLGSLILVIVVIALVFGKFPFKASEVAKYYTAEYNAEVLGGIISSLSRKRVDMMATPFNLSKGKCDLKVTSEYVELTIYAQEIKADGKKIKIPEQRAKYEFLQVEGITVEPFTTECSEDSKTELVVRKIKNRIEVMRK